MPEAGPPPDHGHAAARGLILHPDVPALLVGRAGPLYVAYHDTEWGVPEHDSRASTEKLILDGFQAGLS